MAESNNKNTFRADYELTPVILKSKDWRDFHEIVRTALFEQTSEEYDVESVDTYLPRAAKRTPLLLKFKDQAVGTIAIDDLGDGRAVIRLVAISNEHQGKGHGRVLLSLAAEMAKVSGIGELCVNSHSAKTAFYRNAGFVVYEWGPEELEDWEADGASPLPAQMHLKLA
ncbi:GCN5-related N-acetyltransferase [Rhizobium etli CNPAF512]|nr:GCN5-related N-acetyltransferase [Rhizobium etli CNPAF512]